MGIFDKLKNDSGSPGTGSQESESKIARIAEIAIASRSIAEWKCSQTPGEVEPLDPEILSERIGIRFEKEIPDTSSARGDHPEDTEKTLGKPVFHYQGIPLAWEKDPAHIRLFAWATVNLFPGRPLSVDIESTARLLQITPREVRDALVRLVKDGDLSRSTERGRELYRLNVRYPEGGTP